MRKILLAIVILALLAMPAFAAVQNIKVSGDINSTLVVRKDFNLGSGTGFSSDIDEESQNTFITQTRVRIDADLSDKVSATVRLLNERAWDAISSSSTATTSEDVELDLAYVELKEMLYSPLTVTVGRQNLFYGNGLIMGGGPNNATAGSNNLNLIAEDLAYGSAIDAVKLVFDYNPLTIDVFAAKVAENTAGLTDAEDDDADLYGINANYSLGDKNNTTLEGYFFAKIDQNQTLTGNFQKKNDTIYIPGVKATTNLLGAKLSGELAWQSGTDADTAVDQANIKREAMAAQIIASYLLPFEKTAKYAPLAIYSYSYASGDKNPNSDGGATNQVSSETNTAWDPFYESIGGGTIYNSLMDFTNCHVHSLAGQITPIEDVTAKVTWTGLWLDRKLDSTTWALKTPGGSGTTSESVNQGEKEIGYEVDIDLTYAYTEDVSLGLSAGWFMPGDLFVSSNEETASQILTKLNVAF